MIPVPRSLCRGIVAAVCSAFLSSDVSSLLAAELKVDLNRAGRPEAEVNEVGYVPWAIADAVTASRTFDGVTVTFTKPAEAPGTTLTTNWFAAGVRPPINAKLANDGITVRDGNAGGQIEMRISGLAPGPHTVLTYHNTWDNPATNTFSPIDIFVNGEQVVSDLVPSNRVGANSDAPVFYHAFEAQDGMDVVILFAAESGSPASSRNVAIAGFEIDTPNAARQAREPFPADGDEHIDADDGGTVLAWIAAPGAMSHDVYFGDDIESVRAAGRESPEFQGNQVETAFPVDGLDSLLTYAWRIDEIDALGNLTRGTTWYFRPRQLAFADAEGYGRFARGGRGGRVVAVTTLADYDEGRGEQPVVGSLRYAIEQETGPRTIVFDVAGLITLKARLVINDRYVTVAGQTAPGKGVCLRGYTLGLSGARDVVVRHLRSRPGLGTPNSDGMGMRGSDHCILDHCSISWSVDEAFSSRDAMNITLQRTLISEALNIAGHPNYPPGAAHGYAASIGGDIGSFHHNLLAHCAGRNWSLAGGLDRLGYFAGRLDIRNNVVYNWVSRTTDGGAHEVNFVNNTYQPGPATRHFFALTAQYDNFPGTQQYYFAGNVMPGVFDEGNQEAGRRASGFVPTTYSPWVDAPFFPSHVETQAAGEAYKRVLSDVGATSPRLDNHDTRIIDETLTGTTTYVGSVSGLPGIPDSQADVGGWEAYPEISRGAGWDTDRDGLPDWWELAHRTDPHSLADDCSDAHADPDADGFTALDDYLEWMALPRVETVVNRPIQVDLSQWARGYTDRPRFSARGAVHGRVIGFPGSHRVLFIPEARFNGPALFEFTVTDAAGGSMTRTVGVHVQPRPHGPGCE